MAVQVELQTNFGEIRPLYIRINNVEASNHGVDANALARGYISKEAFEARKGYVFECEFTFTADVSKSLWPQAYEELLKRPEFASAIEA